MRGLFLVLTSALLTLTGIGPSYGEIYQLHCRGSVRNPGRTPSHYTARYVLDSRRGYWEENDRFADGKRHGGHGYGLRISHDSIRFGRSRISRYSGHNHADMWMNGQHFIYDEHCWGPLIYTSDYHDDNHDYDGGSY